MTNAVVDDSVEEARGRLGRIGAGLMVPIAPANEWRRTVARLEQAGYGSVWINELIGGRESFAQAGLLLAASERLVVGTSVANLWARHPAAMQGGAAVLADAYPGRFALGIGVSAEVLVEASGQKWERPLQRMRGYLDQMDASTASAPRPAVPFPRLLGALGPKMLALAAERADGALTATMPVEHTRRAREILGPGKLLIVGQIAVPETDPDTARAIARQASALDMPGSPYAKALSGLGYQDADLRDGGTDALVDARSPWGDAETIAARLRAHLDAGADHICVNVLALDLDSAADQFEKLAPALTVL
ncbi:probable F420-dependent oxidoreductase, MSMEG_4141 family [Thermomonospora echinospora]|uniref:Probable F420-dependent oxidoreductase, MSMEG_4141 family n=1 Tax=Thermomonospora echinospora TaxID=1992 RepID=A0A1H6C7G4_9ACTN|nr:TIGR03620 family F420-dependent LLM class oxidoreductase [Thermomonospora echinospora]SEG68565.1 probable F420-dependent oxidoreductase, MSMEG_4141 family [Thermomonospora echinospora]